MAIYKYYPPEAINYIFNNKGISLRFTQASALNDPLEAKPFYDEETFEKHLLKKIKSQNKKLSKKEIQVIFEYTNEIEYQKWTKSKNIKI